MKYIIPSGQNKSCPLLPLGGFAGPKTHKWIVTFDENCLYPQQYLKGENYDGYSKLCGIAFNPLKPNDNTVMCGWRSKDGVIKITPYFNTNGENIKNENNELSVNPKDLVEIIITIVNNICVVNITSKEKTVTDHLIFNQTYGFLGIFHTINFWFGGQLPAPNLVSANINKII